jgi:hypothetical protein
VRQVLGAISELDKAMTFAKLRGARERKRRDTGKCEGRKSHAERNPELVARAKQLRRHRPKGGRMSLRAISAELAAQVSSMSADGRSRRHLSRLCWRHEETCEAKLAQGRANRLPCLESRGCGRLENGHSVAPGTIPERIWRRFYIQAMTLHDAADVCIQDAAGLRADARRMWSLWRGGHRSPQATTFGQSRRHRPEG